MEHDLSGVWRPGSSDQSASAPMTAAAKAQFVVNTQELKRDHPITIDPAYSCHPPGLPRIYTYGVAPLEIVQTPQRIFIFFESAHMWREIWMDGRDMPKDSDPLWMGYSIGRWDGGSLSWTPRTSTIKPGSMAVAIPTATRSRLPSDSIVSDRGHLQISSRSTTRNHTRRPWTTKRDYSSEAQLGNW